jgi:hypothetical protein
MDYQMQGVEMEPAELKTVLRACISGHIRSGLGVRDEHGIKILIDSIADAIEERRTPIEILESLVAEVLVIPKSKRKAMLLEIGEERTHRLQEACDKLAVMLDS